MQSKPKIWFDCDGVLLDWTRSFLEHSGMVAHYKYEDIKDIDLSKLYADPDLFMKDMLAFHQSEYFKHLQPLVYVSELRKLKQAGYAIHIITQLEDNFVSRSSRMTNLSDFFGDAIDDLWFTVRGESKWDMIMKEHDAREHLIVIEDNPVFLKEASDNRAASDMIYAVKHPYNEIQLVQIPHIKIVNNAGEAITDILRWTNEQRNNNACKES